MELQTLRHRLDLVLAMVPQEEEEEEEEEEEIGVGDDLMLLKVCFVFSPMQCSLLCFVGRGSSSS